MYSKIAQLIRRYPFLIRLPYLIYRQLQPRYTIGVVGVVVDEMSRVLIVEHVFHPEKPWGLPGGWIGRNEEPAVAVAREFKEELTLDIEVTQLLIAEKAYNQHLDLAFQCIAHGSIGALSNELLNYQWVEVNDLPDLKPFHSKAIDLALKSL